MVLHGAEMGNAEGESGHYIQPAYVRTSVTTTAARAKAHNT